MTGMTPYVCPVCHQDRVTSGRDLPAMCWPCQMDRKTQEANQ